MGLMASRPAAALDQQDDQDEGQHEDFYDQDEVDELLRQKDDEWQAAFNKEKEESNSKIDQLKAKAKRQAKEIRQLKAAAAEEKMERDRLVQAEIDSSRERLFQENRTLKARMTREMYTVVLAEAVKFLTFAHFIMDNFLPDSAAMEDVVSEQAIYADRIRTDPLYLGQQQQLATQPGHRRRGSNSSSSSSSAAAGQLHANNTNANNLVQPTKHFKVHRPNEPNYDALKADILTSNYQVLPRDYEMLEKPPASAATTSGVGVNAAASADKMSKKPQHTMESLIAKIREVFPDMADVDVVDSIVNIKALNHGTLSGLSTANIIHMISTENFANSADANNPEGVNAGTLVLPQLPESCAICIEPMNKDNGNAKLTSMEGCGHTFHETCIRAWLTKKQQCPCCRLDQIQPDGACARQA